MPPDDGLTPQAYKLLNVLRESGDWLSRAKLARTIGKAQLTAYDVILLQNMDGKGLIEIRQRHIRRQGRGAFEYKAKRRKDTESRST